MRERLDDHDLKPQLWRVKLGFSEGSRAHRRNARPVFASQSCRPDPARKLLAQG